MFKKKKQPKTFKKRIAEEDDEEEEESVSASVQAIKRRRQVLNGLQYKRGVDAATLSSKNHQDKTEAMIPDEDDSKLPSNTKMTNESQVWKERHEKAMEDYIESKLQQHKDTTTETDQDEEPDSTNTPITSKDQLFQQLATTAQQLSGKTNDKGDTTTLQHQEVLRSGAATAMAEVILPSATTTTQRPKTNRNMPVATTVEAPPAQDGRIGFAAARGLTETKPREPSADEKAYKNFVQRQRR